MALTPEKKPVAAQRMVADRWTLNLASAGWTPISDFFLENYHRLPSPLKYSEAMFIIHVMQHKWDKAAPYPSFGLIAKRMGVSAEAVRLLARSLDKKGYLYRQKRVAQTNKFYFDGLFAALEKLKADLAIEEMNAKRLQELADRSFTPPMRPEMVAAGG